MRRRGTDQTTAVLDNPQDPELGALRLPSRFKPIRVIGRGGMAQVVRCHDSSLNREVAVKILFRIENDHLRQRFLREARASGTLHHPNIVMVHDVAPGGEYLVMELVEGESLSARLRRKGKLVPEEVHRLGGSLLAALSAAHREGIVHRDVKPANILLDTTETVKLTDFGIATFGDHDITQTGQVIGTPAYMAPEQLRGGRADERSDIYSTGATLFEAATGLRLFKDGVRVADPGEALRENTRDAALAAAIERAVREKPEERFASADEFARALVAHPPRGRARHVALAVAGVAVAGGAVLGALYLRDRGTAAPHRVTIAVLPFENTVGDPRLDFASSGLPHLLGEQLGHVSNLDVLGYYRVRARIADANPALAAWRKAATELGADLSVRGELRPGDGAVHVAVIVEHADGSPVDRIERDVPVERVPATVEALASAVGSTALGSPLSLAPGSARDFQIERELELGVAALERMDLPGAREHLQAAVTRDDSLAEAHYYLAILDWWQQPPPEPPETQIALALSGTLEPAQRDFLVGLRMLADLQYPGSVDYFRALARRLPAERDVQYGLFEALFHGGYPAEAMQVYRRVRELAPRFYVGIDHVLLYYTERGDAGGIAWVRAHWDPDARDASLLEARALIAQQSYADAVRALERAAEEDSHDLTEIRRLLVECYAVTGQVALAQQTADTLAATDPAYHALAAWGLAVARGDSARTEDARGLREQAHHAVELGITGIKIWAARLDLVALDLPGGNLDDLRDAARGRPLSGRIVGHDVGATIVADALTDSATLESARRSTFPQVVATAEAVVADNRHDRAAAVEAWRRSVALNSDGRMDLIALWRTAADLRATHDYTGVVTTCDEVITPRVFTWAWASTVGPCLQWSAEAAAALGDDEGARRRWRSLLALRIGAPADDELVRAARAALAKAP